MSPLALTVERPDGSTQAVEVAPAQLLMMGYTGRNRAAVLAHIEELAQLGAPPPARVPSIYPVPPALLTTAGSLVASGPHTSGEAEAALIPSATGLLVCAASDHTDRDCESVDVQAAKALCAKPISASAWLYADVEAHWDALELRAWVTLPEAPASPHAQRQAYQSGRLGDLLPPSDLFAEARSAGHGDLERTALFGGTVPTHAGFVYGHAFEVELHDPLLNRSLRLAYRIIEPPA